ncbi:archease [Methanothrix sp.]|uniref:archease n=1 Tax=Methanothrix sp. TaxID=90426 RepID=UPI003C748B90
MHMIPFQYLEHTADIKFRAYGTTREEMLSNAASALFGAMISPEQVTVQEVWPVELEAEELEDLAYQWLSEIVFLFETESAVFSTFEVVLQEGGEGRGWKLRAEIGGERMDLERHLFRSEVKAVTWHKFAIVKNELWCIQVVLDV